MADLAFRQFVLKVHSRCNLACDYCYVYESLDQSWRDQPRLMSQDTVAAAAARIAEHARAHRLGAVGVTFHGGEPLLLGQRRLRAALVALRAALPPGVVLDCTVQTNGTLLDEAWAGLLLDEGVRVGISLDGGRATTDVHRRYAHGGSSYDDVLRGVRLMARPPYRVVFAGLICVVDVVADPAEVFRDLASVDPPMIDLLLPHATWDAPPPGRVPGRARHGEWLARFFDLWYAAPPRFGVRLFQEIMHTLLGGASSSEAIGLAATGSVVIETDGSVQGTDALKVTYSGAAGTGCDVFQHPLDRVLEHPVIAHGARGLSALSAQCQECPLVHACGGGLYPHRYRSGSGFSNPSVYCADLAHLIQHIDERLRRDLAAYGIGAGARQQ